MVAGRTTVDGAPAPAIDALGARLPDALYRLAFRHRSYCAEHPGEEPNERLEFLGDAVLGLVVAEYLYTTRPELREGDLARIRAAVVSTAALAPRARALGVGEHLLLGKGEESSGGRAKPSLLADALEAVIGALYLAEGLPAAQAFVLEVLGEEIEKVAARAVLGDEKNQLQELAARLGASLPRYVLVERGPDHAKHFSAEVVVGDVTASGSGRSKKEAERAAAKRALSVLAERSGDEPGATYPTPIDPTPIDPTPIDPAPSDPVPPDPAPPDPA